MRQEQADLSEPGDLIEVGGEKKKKNMLARMLGKDHKEKEHKDKDHKEKDHKDKDHKDKERKRIEEIDRAERRSLALAEGALPQRL